MSDFRKSLLIITGLLLAGIGLTGCGGEESAPAEAPPPPPPVVAQPAAPVAQAPVPPKPVPPPEKPKRPEDVAQWQPDDFRSARSEPDKNLVTAIAALGDRSAGKAEAVPLLVELLKPEPPKTPEEAAQVNSNGYRSNGPRPTDPLVVSALIAALGKNNTAESAQVLEALLRGQIDPGTQGRNNTGGILDALIANPGPAHYQILLTAAFSPEQYRPPAAENQPGTMAGGVGASAGAGMTAGQLSQEATNKLKAAASPELRMLLAARIGADSVDIEALRPFVTMLLEPRPENVPAQVVLFSQPRLDPLLKQQVELLLTQLAMATIDQQLGIPQNAKIAAPTGYAAGNWNATATTGGSMNATSTTPTSNYRPPAATFPPNFVPGGAPGSRPQGGGSMMRSSNRPPAAANPTEAKSPIAANVLATLFWNPEFRALVLRNTEGVESIEKTLPAAIFAASLPAAEARSRLAQLNKGLWDEGPKALRFGGLFGEPLHDPGLLLVVKGVPRKEDPARVDARSPKTDQRRTNNSRSMQRRPVTSANDKDRPRYEWMQASEELVYVWNARFLAAALAAPKDDRTKATPVATATEKEDEPAAETKVAKPAKPAATTTDGADRPDDDAFGTRAPQEATADGKLPVELHEDANVVAEYHLNWPADLGDKVAGVKMTPLIVHYVRIEEKNRVPKLVTHYQKFLKGAKLRTIDRGRWIDHVDDGTATGRRRSIDVMVANVNPPAPPPPNQPRGRESKPKVTDEPLVVEILSIEIPNPYPPEDDLAEEKEEKPAKSPKSASSDKDAKSEKKPASKKPATKPAAKTPAKTATKPSAKPAAKQDDDA